MVREGNAKIKTIRPHLPGLANNLPDQDIIFCTLFFGSLKKYLLHGVISRSNYYFLMELLLFEIYGVC